MSITFAMGVVAFVQTNWPLGLTLLIASSVYLVGYLIQKYTGNIDLSSNTILYSLIILMVYLVYSGGVSNTGPLWIFMVAPVALFLHGLKRGLWDIALFVIITSVIMFYPGDALISASYDSDFKVRLILSFLTVTFLSSFYEYSREKSFDDAVKISKEFERLAKYDPLTKLSNRRDAMDKIQHEYNRMKRNDEPLSIMLADIDHFKEINDEYGHDAGDYVLMSLAGFFKNQCRSQDIVARWGGEEFLFILPQTDIEQAQHFANKLLEKVRWHRVIYNRADISCTLSFGISHLHKDTSIEQSLREADIALYQAKNAGRDQVRIAQ
nr:GGDEF domain-containing protein [Motiliproteus coralliicola]